VGKYRNQLIAYVAFAVFGTCTEGGKYEGVEYSKTVQGTWFSATRF